MQLTPDPRAVAALACMVLPWMWAPVYPSKEKK